MLAFLKLIRIWNLLFIALFQFLLRYCIILPVLEKNNIMPMLSTTNFIILVLSTITLAASGNVINDYFDIKADKINKPTKVIVDKHIERRTVVLIHVILTLFGIISGLFISIIYRKETYAFLFVAIPAILWFYSTHFKKQILIGNLIVALLVAISACLVVSVEFAAIAALSDTSILNSSACSTAWLYTTSVALFAFLTNLAREIVKDMEDVDGDIACNCHTLPVDMGIKYSKYIVVTLEIIILIALWVSYTIFEKFQHIPYIEYYILITITLPTIFICIKTLRSKTPKEFHNVSSLCKVVMTFGVLMLPFIYYITK